MGEASKTALVRLAQAPLNAVGGDFYQVSFFALGSDCQLFFAAGTLNAAKHFQSVAAGWLAHFEAQYSRFVPGSKLNQINAMAGIGWVDIDPLTETLLDLCSHFHFVTEGAFDATSLPLTEVWDWRSRRSVPERRELEQARQLVGWSLVQRTKGRIFLPKSGMKLDFGGVGKEFAVDTLRRIAIEMNIQSALVDLGGDIAVHGDSPEGGGWYISLEHPEDISRSYLGLRLPGGSAVATSGDYRRFFAINGKTYGHIIDNRTGCPVDHGTRSVTVVGSLCVTAGLKSTTAMILGGLSAIGMLERDSSIQGCLWSQNRLMETRGFRRLVHTKADKQNPRTPALQTI